MENTNTYLAFNQKQFAKKFENFSYYQLKIKPLAFCSQKVQFSLKNWI